MGCGGLFFRKYVMPVIHKAALYASNSTEECEEILQKSAKHLETHYLKDCCEKRPFMFGEKPSIADMSLGCEL